MSAPSPVEDLRRKYQHQLRILHAIGLSSPDFLYVFDRDQRFIYVSPALLKLWGRTLEDALGKTFAELGYPEDLVALHRQQLDQALAGQVVSGANAYVSAEGVEGHYEYTFVPVAGESGQIDTVVGTTRDVSERTRAERDRKAALEKLRESEEQFRNFADAMPPLAWIADGEGYIFWYNRRWYEYTGTVPAQMEGWGWQSVHDPVELPRVLERWQTSIRSGQPFEMTFPLRGADGRFRHFLTRVNPVRSAAGEIVRWFGTNTDVEEQRQVLAQRDAALAEAKEAVRLREAFLSIASHELRTPLAAMLLQVQGVERQVTAGRLNERLGKASRAGERLARLSTSCSTSPASPAGSCASSPNPSTWRRCCGRCAAASRAAFRPDSSGWRRGNRSPASGTRCGSTSCSPTWLIRQSSTAPAGPLRLRPARRCAGFGGGAGPRHRHRRGPAAAHLRALHPRRRRAGVWRVRARAVDCEAGGPWRTKDTRRSLSATERRPCNG